MTSAINRRQLLRDAARGAIGTTAAVGLMSSGVFAEEQRGPEESEHVEGGWYITVEVTQPSPAMFDALYGFGKGGEFTRIDGRNNAPAIGTWTRTEDGSIMFSAILFNFVNGVRTGYISGKFIARLIDERYPGRSRQRVMEFLDFYREVETLREPGLCPKLLRPNSELLAPELDEAAT